MDFNLTPEQEALRDSVVRFAERDYGWEQRAGILNTPAGWSADHWRSFAELGWLGAGLAEEAGGFGGGAQENAVLLEGFGKALVVEPIVPHIIATQLLAQADGEEGRALIEAMVAGERRAVLAHDEGRVGEPIATVLSPANGNGVRRLTGTKAVVLGGGDADTLLVSACDAGQGGALSVCLIDRQQEGVETKAYRLVDNHRAADIALDVTVSPDQLLHVPAGAVKAVERAEDHGIVALCAEAVGVIDAAVWLTRDYLQTRKQFDTPLASFQALQHRMADMLIETEMARSIVLAAMGALDGDDARERRRAVSAAKAVTGRSGLAVGASAIQLHGGIGMTEEYIVGHYYKRLFAIARLLGDTDTHLARFADATDMR